MSLFVPFAALDQVFLLVTVFPPLRVLTCDGMSAVCLNFEKCNPVGKSQGTGILQMSQLYTVIHLYKKLRREEKHFHECGLTVG